MTGRIQIQKSGIDFCKKIFLILHRATRKTITFKMVQCHEAKMTHFPNGHYEGPIDFFDQSF